MNIPDWPSLWEKEPGLRPEGLCGDSTHEDLWIYCECGATQVVLSEPIFAALCRDAAVRWLVSKYPERDSCLIVYMTLSGKWCVQNGQDNQDYYGESLDEALFKSCLSSVGT